MEKDTSPLRSLLPTGVNRVYLIVLLLALVLGAGSGIYLASTAPKGSGSSGIDTSAPTNAKSADQDSATFKDFAEGTLKKRPDPKEGEEYQEGTHLLARDDHPIPVALTSSVVDLSEYEGKRVKVYGKTEKAIKEAWLMDVGRVEVIQ